MDIAASAGFGSAGAATLAEGPPRPRGRVTLPSWAPSNSATFGGWYFVASPAAFHTMLAKLTQDIKIQNIHRQPPTKRVVACSNQYDVHPASHNNDLRSHSHRDVVGTCALL